MTSDRPHDDVRAGRSEAAGSETTSSPSRPASTRDHPARSNPQSGRLIAAFFE